MTWIPWAELKTESTWSTHWDPLNKASALSLALKRVGISQSSAYPLVRFQPPAVEFNQIHFERAVSQSVFIFRQIRFHFFTLPKLLASDPKQLGSDFEKLTESMALGFAIQFCRLLLPKHTEAELGSWIIDPTSCPKNRSFLKTIEALLLKRAELSSVWSRLGMSAAVAQGLAPEPTSKTESDWSGLALSLGSAQSAASFEPKPGCIWICSSSNPLTAMGDVSLQSLAGAVFKNLSALSHLAVLLREARVPAMSLSPRKFELLEKTLRKSQNPNPLTQIQVTPQTSNIKAIF